MDAPEDRDVKLQKVSGDLLSQFNERLPHLLQPKDTVGGSNSGSNGRGSRQTVLNSLISLIDPFQESPQLLDPYLQSYMTQLTTAFLTHLSTSTPSSSAQPPPDQPTALNAPLPFHDGVSKLLYTLCKIRGPKIISRFLPNEPRHLEPLCDFARRSATDAATTWELRYVLLLWLSHLCLTPFDLITISSSDPSALSPPLPPQLDIAGLPSLSRRLLALGLEHLASPGNRESDAAALLLDRLCLRKDMRAIGLLDSLVSWCLDMFRPGADTTLFLRTAILRVLAGILAQGDRDTVSAYAARIFALATRLEAGAASSSEEWNSANVRRLVMKIYRWVALLSLAPSEEEEEGGNTVEDIIERLLSCLGDKDTAVRFGASKSLAVISRKLPPDLSGEVLEAVMAIYDEDVFYHPAPPGSGEEEGGGRVKVLSAVTAEKWHGATLTLATFLRQRAVRSTGVLARVVRGITDALHFEQRRATFALGGNVRDAACYAAWSLARSYTTAELLAVGGEEEEGTSVQQVLATELAVAGCLDPLGNIRRAASAALQELIGRHPETVVEGIRVVQVVDYNAVALRRRSVVQVAGEISALDERYWSAIVCGIIEGWRGIGGSDIEGRKLSGSGLREVVKLSLPTDTDDNPDARNLRARKVLTSLVRRIRTEGKSDVEIWHGSVWALAEVLDGLCALPLSSSSPLLTPTECSLLLDAPFEKLVGKEFVNPILRPELTSEAASRLVSALSSSFPLLLSPHLATPPARTLRLWTAVLEASLDRNDDIVLAQAVPATKHLFGILPPPSRHALIETWCRRASPPGKKRGPVLALGEILGFAYGADAAATDTIVRTLVSAAGREGEVELRVAGVRALGAGVMAREGIGRPEVAGVLLAALDDYEVDSRGDVGSWARAEAIRAVWENWGCEGWRRPGGEAEWEVVKRLVRLSAERLDRMRARACEALLKISASWGQSGLESFIDRPQLTSDLAANSISSASYFTSLMPLLQHQTLAVPLLTGLVTSAGAGSDSLLKTSRSVLLSHNTAVSSADPQAYITAFLDPMLKVLTAASSSDRVVVPALEVVAAVLEMTPRAPPPDTDGADGSDDTKALQALFAAVQKLHFKSGNPQKLSAAVRAYAGVLLAARSAELRRKVLGKLAGMLLHPFPRVRELVAETVWVALHFGVWEGEEAGREEVERVLAEGDWLGGVKEVRAGVGVVRRYLGV